MRYLPLKFAKLWPTGTPIKGLLKLPKPFQQLVYRQSGLRKNQMRQVLIPQYRKMALDFTII